MLIFSFALLTVFPSTLYAEMKGIPSEIEKAALNAGKEAAATAAQSPGATKESVAVAAAAAAAQVALDAGLTDEQAKELANVAAIRAAGGTSIFENNWEGWVLAGVGIGAIIAILLALSGGGKGGSGGSQGH